MNFIFRHVLWLLAVVFVSLGTNSAVVEVEPYLDPPPSTAPARLHRLHIPPSLSTAISEIEERPSNPLGRRLSVSTQGRVVQQMPLRSSRSSLRRVSTPRSLVVRQLSQFFTEGLSSYENINVQPACVALATRLNLPCAQPQAYPKFWKGLKKAAQQPESLYAINHAVMISTHPRKYYAELDYDASKSIAALDRSAKQYIASRNRIAHLYMISVTHVNLPHYKVLARHLLNPSLIRALPTFSGVLFWRGVVNPYFCLAKCLTCLSGKSKSGSRCLGYLDHDELYSLTNLLGLPRDDFFMGSRKPYEKWYAPMSMFELRVVLLCRNCRYIQPLLRNRVPAEFDAASFSPSSGQVRVVEMVETGGNERTLILSEY